MEQRQLSELRNEVRKLQHVVLALVNIVLTLDQELGEIPAGDRTRTSTVFDIQALDRLIAQLPTD